MRIAEDYEAGGPIAEICDGWSTNARKDALGLRLTGALHYAVLSGQSGALKTVYPKARTDWSMDAVWPITRDWLSANIAETRAFIQSPPQTNETRRSIALLPGFLALADHFQMPIRLLELGASAGLNQFWDLYAYQTDSWSWQGREDSNVLITTDWQAAPPTALAARPEVISRAACDLSPIALDTDANIHRLTCYTWPDQPERLQRLRAAIKLAQTHNVYVEKADAADWLERKLNAPVEGVLTVVYHSVFLVYPPKEVIARIKQTIEVAGARANRAAPLAWLCYEPEGLFGGDTSSPDMHTRLQSWPDGPSGVLLESDGHIRQVHPKT